MNENILDFVAKINFHRNNHQGFLYIFFKNLYFDESKYLKLINDIQQIKIFYRQEECVPRNIVSWLFSINSMFQSRLGDVTAGKCIMNISQQELFDYWEELNFAIQDFFDDVTRD